MSRLHFKGGAWTNAEDEVMKAALAQYGLRDWERVASMLTKKTAMQCRERWENYLDPRLNIHEAWSLEEEEKLVELQALFPHKWRLIAEQLTRRTPNHYIRPAWLCEQRYLELKDEQEYYLKEQQQLLKDAPGGAPGEKQSLESYMAERRRQRIARKTHEERASRADTVSGERCEREMIDMATSRLANQDQKKGLRKERQQQLAEAAFLAKLESNREGIESGTLSLHQARKMKKALEEDRETSGLVDEIEEAFEETSAKDEGRGVGDDDDDADGGVDENRNFKAIDMYEDQQQAGLVKKQRVLMKDLTGQQRLIQQRQMGIAADGNGNEGSVEASSGRSRARAALTGVNEEILKQLTSAPIAASPSLLENRTSGIRAGTAAGAPVSSTHSIVAAADAEVKEELRSTLAELFAALPSSSRAAPTPAGGSTSLAAATPPPPLSPPLKRPREASKSVTGAGGGDGDVSLCSRAPQQRAPDFFPYHSAGDNAAEGKRSDDRVSGDLFRALDLPAPRKVHKTDIVATLQPDSSKGFFPDSKTSAPGKTDASASDIVVSSAPVTNLHPYLTFTKDEAKMRLQDARRWVAVECERGMTAMATNTTPAGEQLTPTQIRAAQSLVEQELCSDNRGAKEDARETNGLSPEYTTTQLPSGSVVTSMRAYTSIDSPHAYGSDVNVQHALHQLSQRVAAQVREANAILRPLRQEWLQVMSTAMLSPHDTHALYGYLRNDGQLKGLESVGDGAENDEGGQAASSVAAYVCERLINQLRRARLATRFTKELRDREALKMRRILDEAEHDLQQLQSRERTLQELYRQKRVQQSCHA